MKTFSRRARQTHKKVALFTDQPADQQLAAPEEDPYWLPEALPEPSPIKHTSPAPKPAPKASKPSQAEATPRSTAASSRRGGGGAEPGSKQPAAKQPLLQKSDQQANKPSSTARSGGRGSGRSTGSNLRGVNSKPAAAAAAAATAAPARSGRLLGANKGRGPSASPAVKRKSSPQEAAEQDEGPSKKPRAIAATKLAAPALAPPLAAAPSPSSAEAAAAGAPLAAAAALPVAMARLLNPAALRDSAPAQTVIEAQELGEQSRYRDDAMWALDGLCLSSSPNTLRESVVALLDICASRRGRLALRSGGVAEEVVGTLGKLKLGEDAVLALGAAAILACFCQADADPALLAKAETAQLITALLKVEESVPESSAPASFAGRILKVLREGPFGRLLPPEESTHPASVVLAAVAALLDPNQRCVNMDPCKHALRTAGALQRVAQLAADHGGAVCDAVPTMQTVRALWKLNRSLVVLENACFACPDNEAHLATVRVTAPARPARGGGGSGGGEVGLAEWVVQQVEVLGQQGLSRGFKKDCLRALLAVLMNMTQNNSAGCEGVVAAGVLEAAAPVLAQIAQGGPRNKGCLHDSNELEAWVDELSCCLGLLINLMEHQAAWRGRLRQLAIPRPPSSAGSGGVQGEEAQPAGMVPLLCSLLTCVIPTSRYADGPASPLARRLSSLSTGEITVETLEDSGADGGAASIVEVYAAILLGFLVEGDAAARSTAAALLPTGTLEPVAAAVQRCLHFYVSAGAMTKGNEESLRGLLASLEADEEGGGGAGQQAAQQQ